MRFSAERKRRMKELHDKSLATYVGTERLEMTLMVRVPQALASRLYERAERLGVSWESMARPLLVMLVEGRLAIVGPDGELYKCQGVSLKPDAAFKERMSSDANGEGVRELENLLPLRNPKDAAFFCDGHRHSHCNPQTQPLGSAT